MSLGELVPTDQGYYLVAQASEKNIFTHGLQAAVTYHYIDNKAWTHIMDDMESGKLHSVMDFSRLDNPAAYKAIEGYGSYANKIAKLPFQIEGDYLKNLDKTAPGLKSDAGWQQAAWTRLTLWKHPVNPGDWNVWGEWGRTQPNSVISWLTDNDRGGGDTQWWAVAWNYRLMHNTDFDVEYFNRQGIISPDDKSQVVHVDIMTRF